MIAAQRRALILERVRQQGGAAIVDLADVVGVSASTVRRDLDYLMREGYLERRHGGALLAEPERTTFEPRQDIGAHMARSAKVAIGRRAAALLEPGQSVLFDSSSTVLEAARAIAGAGLRLTACTNDLGIAMALTAADCARILVLGGSVRPGSLTLTGDPGQSFLDHLHADVALVGIHSLARGRLSETAIEVVAIKRRMIESAARVVVLADSSKFSHPAFCDVCELNRISMVVTDSGIAGDARALLEEQGVALAIAEPVAE
ncbi:MAG: DeoR/GlpR family DNA-binding transcription regulator [Geminicoccaceae bacterium]